MCGIFGYVGSKGNAPEIVFDGLKSLEYRGYDSWGIATIPKGHKKVVVQKKTGKIGSLKIDRLPPSTIAIGHTRWATHGGVTNVNAHPHLDCEGNIAVIHNGIFENYESFKNSLIKKRHKFVSETDTETIPHLLEEQKGGLSKKVLKVFNKMEGLNAVIAISTQKDEIVAVRNGSPLVVGFGKDKNYLASDASALLPYTRLVYFLEDDEMAILSVKKTEIVNVKTGKKKVPKKIKLNWKIDQGQKGKHKHFMIKEIFEQPKIISQIASSINGLEKVSKDIKSARGIYFVGCGSASYAAIAGTYLFSKVAKAHINFAIGSEFSYHLDFLNSNSLIIPISQSGETMDILESVKKAKERKAKIISLTNILGSSLYRLSDKNILLGAGPEKAVASTKALTAMIAHLILLSYTLAGKQNEGQKILEMSVKSMNYLYSKRSIENIKKLAKKINNKNHMYVIGRGLSYPASLETALKIKEISYIHAEGLAAGELKHGPIALIEKGTPAIAFLPNDETYGSNLAGAMEMKARGGYIIGVSHKNHEVFDYFIEVKDAKEATLIPNIVVAQLLSYYLTLEKNLDPDKPRNLAKSVTVK